MEIGFLIPQAGDSPATPGPSLLGETGQCQELTEAGIFSVLLNDAVKKMDDTQTPPPSDADNPIEPAPLAAVDNYAMEAASIGIAGAACSQLCDVPEAATPVAGKAEQQPVLSHDQQNELSVKHEDSQITNGPAIRNGRSTPANLAPVPFGQPAGDPPLPHTMSSGSLTANQKPIPVMEEQAGGDLPSLAYVNGNAQSPGGPSPTVPEQGEQETTGPGQALSVRMMGASGAGGQDLSGAFAQGEGEGRLLSSSMAGTPESAARGQQLPHFDALFTPAQQPQPSPQGTGASVVTPAADQLKLTQAFLGEDHLATVTGSRGMAQTVQVELPSHEAGPLSVRISMTEQTVHAQFTTDRSDLGAVLIGRQDQLQQNLTRSGFELGQFQVHINQEGRQETFADRQSRRHGGAPEQQSQSQGHEQHAQDRERPHHRPTRALSLFA